MNASPAEILARSRVIGLVGASNKPDRASYGVMQALQLLGFRVIPVNPGLAGQEVLGEIVYAKLADIPEKVDMVDVFRAAPAAPGIVDEAVAIGATAVWLQMGIVSEDAARKANVAGIDFVQDRCTKVEAMRNQIRH